MSFFRASEGAGKSPISVVIHGGAWAIPDEFDAASVAGCSRAARRAFDILLAGGSAVDAVEAAVCVLEDDPAFDAGTGSVLNDEGRVEMDACIMDGRAGLKSGGVAAVQSARNPIMLARYLRRLSSLSPPLSPLLSLHPLPVCLLTPLCCLQRRVMVDTPHALIVGAGADRFLTECGDLATATPEELVTPEAIRQYELYGKYGSAVEDLFNGSGSGGSGDNGTGSGSSKAQAGHDTVGAVACDAHGHVAAATSTGGISMKRRGRVGDSPLPGSGLYADNALGAASTTGHGESIMRYLYSLSRCLSVCPQLTAS
jgi:beta-aspartyl-peptidase (threonine type)